MSASAVTNKFKAYDTQEKLLPVLQESSQRSSCGRVTHLFHNTLTFSTSELLEFIESKPFEFTVILIQSIKDLKEREDAKLGSFWLCILKIISILFCCLFGKSDNERLQALEKLAQPSPPQTPVPTSYSVSSISLPHPLPVSDHEGDDKALEEEIDLGKDGPASLDPPPHDLPSHGSSSIASPSADAPASTEAPATPLTSATPQPTLSLESIAEATYSRELNKAEYEFLQSLAREPKKVRIDLSKWKFPFTICPETEGSAKKVECNDCLVLFKHLIGPQKRSNTIWIFPVATVEQRQVLNRVAGKPWYNANTPEDCLNSLKWEAEGLALLDQFNAEGLNSVGWHYLGGRALAEISEKWKAFIELNLGQRSNEEIARNLQWIFFSPPYVNDRSYLSYIEDYLLTLEAPIPLLEVLFRDGKLSYQYRDDLDLNHRIALLRPFLERVLLKRKEDTPFIHKVMGYIIETQPDLYSDNFFIFETSEKFNAFVQEIYRTTLPEARDAKLWKLLAQSGITSAQINQILNIFGKTDITALILSIPAGPHERLRNRLTAHIFLEGIRGSGKSFKEGLMVPMSLTKKLTDIASVPATKLTERPTSNPDLITPFLHQLTLLCNEAESIALFDSIHALYEKYKDRPTTVKLFQGAMFAFFQALLTQALSSERMCLGTKRLEVVLDYLLQRLRQGYSKYTGFYRSIITFHQNIEYISEDSVLKQVWFSYIEKLPPGAPLDRLTLRKFKDDKTTYRQEGRTWQVLLDKTLLIEQPNGTRIERVPQPSGLLICISDVYATPQSFARTKTIVRILEQHPTKVLKFSVLTLREMLQQRLTLLPKKNERLDESGSLQAISESFQKYIKNRLNKAVRDIVPTLKGATGLPAPLCVITHAYVEGSEYDYDLELLRTCDSIITPNHDYFYEHLEKAQKAVQEIEAERARKAKEEAEEVAAIRATEETSQSRTS